MEHSSAAAETIVLQAMFDTNMFARKVVEQMCAQGAEGMQCIALMDNQDLSSYIHHLNSNVEADGLQVDIFELEKNLEQKKIAQEVKCVESASNAFTAI